MNIRDLARLAVAAKRAVRDGLLRMQQDTLKLQDFQEFTARRIDDAVRELAELPPVRETVRAHVMTEDEFTKYKNGGTKIALQVRQEIKDRYKGQGYAGIDVYSPGEEILFRLNL